MIWLVLMSIVSCRSSAPIFPSSLTLVVAATPGISNAIVKAAIEEAAAIWSSVGVTLVRRASTGSSLAIEPPAIQVVLDDERGRAPDQDLPLGWINFTPTGAPEPIVHLSFRNVTLLVDTMDAYRNRPASYKELLMARALGRALAHELGHYLTGSKAHSPSGLMKGRRLLDEFFSPTRGGFQLDDDERRLATHRRSSFLTNPG